MTLPPKKKIPLKVRNSNDRFPSTVEKAHMPTCRSYPVVRRGVKGSQPRDCNVKCLYPYRAASVSVAFILSVVSTVVSPPHQSYQSAPQLLAARAAATGMRNTGSTEKPFSQLCLDTCRRYDDRGF